jgi:hypothetical protein
MEGRGVWLWGFIQSHMEGRCVHLVMGFDPVMGKMKTSQVFKNLDSPSLNLRPGTISLFFFPCHACMHGLIHDG